MTDLHLNYFNFNSLETINLQNVMFERKEVVTEVQTRLWSAPTPRGNAIHVKMEHALSQKY